MRSSFVAAVAAALSVYGCRTTAPAPAADVKVVGGYETPDTDMPATVRLARASGVLACTGTFIGPNALLTAAHCRPYELTALGHVPKTVVYPGLDYAKVHPRDMAVMIFAADIAPAVAAISSTRGVVGGEVKLVGYGCAGGGPSDVRRAGKSEILEISMSGVSPGMLIVGRPANFEGEEEGDDARSCPGDSGGALYQNDAVVGVTSGIGRYSDVHWPENQALLRAAVARGAKIPGIEAEAMADEVLVDGELWVKQAKALEAGMKQAADLVHGMRQDLALPADEYLYVDTLPIYVAEGAPLLLRPHGRELLRYMDVFFDGLYGAKIIIDGTGDHDWIETLSQSSGIDLDADDWTPATIRGPLSSLEDRHRRGFLLFDLQGEPGAESYRAELIRNVYKPWPESSQTP